MKRMIISIICIITLLFNVNAYAAVQQPIHFLQQDEEWGFEKYSISKYQDYTIGTSGCGPTAIAMILNYYVDDSITPLQTAMFAMANNHRTRNNGTSWLYFEDMAKEYGLEFLQTASSQEALDWMNEKDNALIVCSMPAGSWTNGGHFILIWRVDENNIAYVNDPNSIEDEKTQVPYDSISEHCRQYFCFNKTVSSNLTEKYSFLFNNFFIRFKILI